MTTSSALTLSQKWASALADLGALVGQAEMESWFRDVRLLELNDGKARLAAPSSLHASRLIRLHLAPIRQALGVTFCQIEVQEISLSPDLTSPLLSSPPPAQQTATPRPPKVLNAPPLALNPEYSFGNFIVGPCNRFAHAASVGVSEKPGQSFNPLFLHGSVGLGKTHLLQAIADQILRDQPNARIAFLSCEQFVNHFIGSLQQGNTDSFRNRYRQVDVLIVDDIQMLANKMRTQEEFFHTFNVLHNAKKQIVLASDAPPEEITGLQERLMSRFKWGLVAEIDRPCFETRVAILRAKATRIGLTVPQEVTHFIAENVEDSVRDLEGSLTRLHAMASLTGRPISIGVAREVFHSTLQRKNRPVQAEALIRVISRHYRVSIEDLKSKKRTHSIVFPRQVAMFLLRQLTPFSLEEVGHSFGGRDHSTVVYAVEKMKARQRVDTQFATELADLEREIRTGSSPNV
ncbi:MAG: chromosomal replication initiator protein DnaA [Planctomycetota bacterium]|nr:chromosomal replication initiator protein DnaA [Planctomycetota bacterium]